jgi:hypothetical protein
MALPLRLTVGMAGESSTVVTTWTSRAFNREDS